MTRDDAIYVLDLDGKLTPEKVLVAYRVKDRECNMVRNLSPDRSAQVQAVQRLHEAMAARDVLLQEFSADEVARAAASTTPSVQSRPQSKRQGASDPFSVFEAAVALPFRCLAAVMKVPILREVIVIVQFIVIYVLASD